MASLMNPSPRFVLSMWMLSATLTASLFGAPSAKTYQVSGPIVSLTDTTVVVQKGEERWEIARDPKTKSNAELKVGDKVTVHYRMVATAVDVKNLPDKTNEVTGGDDSPKERTAPAKR